MNLKGIWIAAVLCTAAIVAKAQVVEYDTTIMTISPEESNYMAEPPPVGMEVPAAVYEEIAAEDVRPHVERIAVKIVINMQGRVTSAKAVSGRSSTSDAAILREAEQRARGLVYEAAKTTRPDQRIVFVRVGEIRNRNRGY